MFEDEDGMVFLISKGEAEHDKNTGIAREVDRQGKVDFVLS